MSDYELTDEVREELRQRVREAFDASEKRAHRPLDPRTDDTP